jgi:hypothetical protein
MSTKAYKFQERDGDILRDIYKHRYLSISQIQRLHFPSLQTAYRRMRALAQLNLIATFSVPNINEAIFGLKSKGLDLLCSVEGVERSDLKWSDGAGKPKDYYFMRHFLAINDFRITLRESCKLHGIELLGFIPDYFGERNDKGVGEKYIKDMILDKAAKREQVSHTPDGVFALRKGDKQLLFFLEIDRGTEVIGDPNVGVLKSLRFYIGYLLENKYQRYAKDFGGTDFRGFRVMFVTTTQARLQNIRTACNALDVPPKAKQFVWLAPAEKITDRTLLQSVWVSADSTDPTTYSVVR